MKEGTGLHGNQTGEDKLRAERDDLNGQVDLLLHEWNKARAENGRLHVTIQRLEGEARYLQALYREEQAENDQWQTKLAKTQAELEQLRLHDKEATDLTIDQQVEIGRLYLALKRLVEDGGSDARRQATALLAERGA